MHHAETFKVQRVVPNENEPGKVSRQHGDTARLAALQVRPRTGSQRARVLDLIQSFNEWGLTRDEISQILSLSPNTVRPRVRELVEGGHVVVSDQRRKTVTGADAEVLVASRHARHSEKLS